MPFLPPQTPFDFFHLTATTITKIKTQERRQFLLSLQTWLSPEASRGGLGQCDLPSPLVEGLWGEGGGDAEMCRVGTGRDVPRVMAAGLGLGKRKCVIREGLWEAASSVQTPR